MEPGANLATLARTWREHGASKEWSKSARANFGVNPTTRLIVQTIGVNPRSHQKQIAVTRFFRLQMQIRLTNPKYFWPQARDFGLHFGD
jgi:hypothetical protein